MSILLIITFGHYCIYKTIYCCPTHSPAAFGVQQNVFNLLDDLIHVRLPFLLPCVIQNGTAQLVRSVQ